MNPANRPEGALGLVQQVAQWRRAEDENRELKERVASALQEIKSFLAERRADLERRRGRVLQTGGFKDETRAMETALNGIEQLFAEGRNVSRIFADIDKYLKRHDVDDTLSRLHTRTELADARDDFMCAFHDSVRGTRLAALLDVLYFMPFAFWRPRGLERRNYRSPSAAEILGVLGELGRRNVDVDGLESVALAAVVRIQLGITPRMNYHAMPANRLAEQLTDAENLTRFSGRVTPPDATFCRTAEGILANLRRWSAELFAGAVPQAPPAVEAEMLQIVFLAPETIRLAGTEKERGTDFLWLLATVVASGHATLKDTLSWPAVRNTRFTSVHERILAAKAWLEQAAVLADGALAARWREAKEQLAALTVRSEALCARQALELGEFTELEQLKDRRSDIGKSLIRIADSLQLLEPALLDVLSGAGDAASLSPAGGHLRALGPGSLIDRNRSHADETRQIARQELEKLRVLIGRIAAISRRGFAASAAPETPESRAGERPQRRTSDGVAVGELPAAEVRALLLGSLRKASVSVQDCKSRIEAVRKRVVKSDLLQALNVLVDKFRKAADACDRSAADAAGGDRAPEAAEAVAAALRECLAAQTGFASRAAGAKLGPAEKQPLATTLNAVKAKIGDDLRDVECLRAELAERPPEAQPPAAPPRTAAEEPTAAPSAGGRVVAAANRALRPVKERMTLLNAAFAAPGGGAATVLAATLDLKAAIGGAWELLADDRELAEALAAGSGAANDEHAGRFDRWQRQLDAVDTETDRLLAATEILVEVETSVSAAANAPDGGGGARALEAIAHALARLREAREACAAAAGAEWRVLKGASGFLARSRSSLDACEAALQSCRSRSTSGEIPGR